VLHTGSMSGTHDPFPRLQPAEDGTDPAVGDSWSGDPCPSAEQRAYAEALIAADVAELYAWLPPADDPAFDALAWELGLVVLDGEEARVAQVAATLVDLDRSAEVFCDDSHLLDQLTGPATPGELGTLAHIHVEALAHPQDRLAYLQRLEKVEGLLAALKVKGLVAIAGESASLASMDEAHVATEVALARRVGQRSASTTIEVARALSSTFPQFLAALHDGEISEWHCRELVSSTRSVTDDDVLRQVAAEFRPVGQPLLRRRGRPAQGDDVPGHPHRLPGRDQAGPGAAEDRRAGIQRGGAHRGATPSRGRKNRAAEAGAA